MFSGGGRTEDSLAAMTLLHSTVRLKSVELITIPFHTWREEVSEEQARNQDSNFNLDSCVKDDR